MRVPVDNVGDFGLAKDYRDRELPPNAWTDARNVGFLDHKVRRGFGSVKLYDPPSVAPYGLHYTIDLINGPALVYLGLMKAFVVQGGVHSDITRMSGDYSGGASDRWNGDTFAGVSILNNGIDVPQQWAPVSSSTLLADLANWPSTKRAKVIRAFKNFLIAMDVTTSGTRAPHRVLISHPAAPGAVPSSWDVTDPAVDARQRDIVDKGGGALIDGVPLGDTFVLYKERSTHAMTFIGGVEKWKTAPIFEVGGILAQSCAVAFDEGSQHFVATGEDVIIHNGQPGSRQSVLSKKLKRWLQQNLSSTKYDRSFCMNFALDNSVWFCFPTEGSDWPNMAITFNWVDGQVTLKDLPQTSAMVEGLVDAASAGPTWDSSTDTWQSASGPWNSLATKPFLRQLIASVPDATQLRQMESTNQNDGVSFSAYVERTGLDLMGIDRYGHLVRDQQKRKLVRGIWPRMSGGPVSIQIGSQDRLDGAITWSATQTFTPGVDEKVDFAVEAKLYGIRFTWSGDVYGELDGFDVDVEALGDY